MTNQVQNALFGMYDGLNQVRDDATRRRAGQSIASGDYNAGAQELLSGGMLSDGMAVQGAAQDRDRQEQADQLEFMREAARMLVSVRDQSNGDANALARAWQGLMPVFQRMPGADPAMIDQYWQAIQADPGVLDRMLPAIEYEIRAAAGGLYAINPNNLDDRRTLVEPQQRITMTPWGPMGSPEDIAALMGAQGGGQGEAYDPNVWGTSPPNPSRPGAGQPRPGPERSQTPTVSFNDHRAARSAIEQLVPGVSFTSGPRTEADQARLRRQGYNPSDTSFHLQSRAWDLVPPRGMSMAQLADRMRGAGFRVLGEGHHVHVSW